MALKSTTKITESPIKLYIGIDVHLKSWHVTICSASLVLQSFTQPPQVEVLVNYLNKHYPDADCYSVYEAGFSGFWVHRALILAGITNIVVNAADIPTTDKEKRQKRDKSDSLKLARTLRSGILRGIYIPSVQEQEDRSLIRSRKQLVRDIARYKNRIKSHLYYKGVVIPERFLRSGGYWNKSFKGWIEGTQLSTATGSLALQEQLQTLYTLEERLKQINRAIRALAKSERFKEQMDLITSIPGIGVISAMIVLTEIGTIDRFKRTDQLNSFAGFIPNVYASGEKEYVGSLTKRGNHHLRTTIIECSWVAVRKDPALTLAYEKLCLRMRPSKAIVRIARKLLGRLRHVLLHNEPYQLGISYG